MMQMTNESMIRYNMVCTIGCRAAQMDSMGAIDLPSGSIGEDVLAMFAVDTMRSYLNEESDICFDEYIEAALMKRFPKGGSQYE